MHFRASGTGPWLEGANPVSPKILHFPDLAKISAFCHFFSIFDRFRLVGLRFISNRTETPNTCFRARSNHIFIHTLQDFDQGPIICFWVSFSRPTRTENARMFPNFTGTTLIAFQANIHHNSIALEVRFVTHNQYKFTFK